MHTGLRLPPNRIALQREDYQIQNSGTRGEAKKVAENRDHASTPPFRSILLETHRLRSMAANGEMRIVLPSESRLETNGSSDVQETGMVRRSPFSRSTRIALSPKLCSTPTSSLCHGCTASTIVVERHPVRPHLVAVWLEVFQSKAVPSRDADISMEAEARDRRTARTGHNGGIRPFLNSADFHDALAGVRTHGDAPGDRSAVKLGEQRLLLPESIRFLRISPRPQTATLKQTSDAPAYIGGDPGDFPIAGRRHMLEYDLTLFVFEV